MLINVLKGLYTSVSFSSVVSFRRSAGGKHQKHGWRKRAAHKIPKHTRFAETGGGDDTQTSRTLSKVQSERKWVCLQGKKVMLAVYGVGGMAMNVKTKSYSLSTRSKTEAY